MLKPEDFTLDNSGIIFFQGKAVGTWHGRETMGPMACEVGVRYRPELPWWDDPSDGWSRVAQAIIDEGGNPFLDHGYVMGISTSWRVSIRTMVGKLNDRETQFRQYVESLVPWENLIT